MYVLTKHAFACALQGHVVILDIRNNAYIAIQPPASHWLCDWVADWPVMGRGLHVSGSPDNGIVHELLARGILTKKSEEGHGPCQEGFPPPIHSLFPRDDNIFNDPLLAKPSLADGARFAGSCLRAWFETRHRSLEAIVASLRRDGTGFIHEPDILRARAVVSAYRNLRPLLFGTAQRCLYHSLSMLHFLRAHKIHARWVFGVQLGPFSAHCWLQQGTVVFNDSIDRIRRFTPIMYV